MDRHAVLTAQHQSAHFERRTSSLIVHAMPFDVDVLAVPVAEVADAALVVTVLIP
jgi:hypothetical protein